MKSGVGAIRLWAVGILVLVFGYFVLRVMATNCAGSGCDTYIPLSELVPLLILVTAAVTGVLATAKASRGSRWFAPLLISTVLGVAGPPISLLIFRDNPDAFVAVGTVLELLVVFTVLAYSFFA